MQRLPGMLRDWIPRIERATYSTVVVSREHDTVLVRATWVATRVHPAGEHVVVFDRKRLFGTTAGSPPLKQRPVKTLCRFVQDAVAEILQARGLR